MTFEELYHEHKNTVFNLALQYTQNVEDAEEITQDVFVKIYENQNSFRNQSAIKTWIYRIAINQSLDFLKAKKRKKRSWLSKVLKIDGTAFETAHFNHPGAELEQKEALEHIFKCLNQLPDSQKTVIILLKIDSLSQQQVADIMKISTKAVESLFQRAKKNLEILLKENEGK